MSGQLAKPLKLSELVKQYVSKNRRIEYATAEVVKRSFRYLVEAVGDLDITEFGYPEAEDYQAALDDRESLDRSSVNRYCSHVSPVFSWAVVRGLLKKNPFTGLPKLKVTKPPVKFFTLDEVQRLLYVANDMWKIKILMGITSMRPCEVMNARVEDVDFSRRRIRITAAKDGPFTWRFSPKDHELRILPLIQPLSVLLLKRFDRIPKAQPYYTLTQERYSYLMEQKGRGDIRPRLKKRPDNNFDRSFRALCNRACVEGSFGMLKKTCLTELSEVLRPQELKDYAGHSSMETTNRYTGSRNDVLTRAGDCLNRGVAQFG